MGEMIMNASIPQNPGHGPVDEASGAPPKGLSSLLASEGSPWRPFDEQGVMLRASPSPLAPEAVLAVLLDAERRRGRVRRRPNAPRELDLDLLTLGDVRCRTPELTLPHPRLGSRRFVLAPLAELAPEYAAALAALDDPHGARNIGKLALPETLPVYSRAL